MSKSEKIEIGKYDFDDSDNSDGKSKFKISGYGYRHQQTLVMFLCLSTAYSMRACMGVALVGMIDDIVKPDVTTTNYTDFSNTSAYNATEVSLYVKLSGNDSVDNVFEADFNNSQLNDTKLVESDDAIELNLKDINETNNVLDDNKKLSNKVLKEENVKTFEAQGFLNALLFSAPFPKFYWSKKIQDTVQSSFFWGYMLLQIPGGQLVHRFGARRLLTAALGINSFISFVFPWISYYGGWICALICRFLQGLTQACIVPGIHSFFGKWAPLDERARLVGFAQGGQALGTVLGIPVTAFISASAMGWPGIFRFYGILSGLCAFVVYYVIADTPSQHPKISHSERMYIEKGMGIVEGKKKHPIPWSKILRCRALYAMMLAHIGQTWGQVTLFTEVPAFMDKVMNVNIKANGLLTALPFLVMWFTSFFFNWFTDMIINKKYLSVTNARKLANSLGCLPASLGLIILAFAPKNMYVVESLLVFICAFKISTHVGFMVNHIDMTPNFAGTTMSLSNFVSNFVGSQAPMVAAFILTDERNESQWRTVFFIASGFYFFTNLAYLILGSAETAPWNEPQDAAVELDRQETQPMIQQPNEKSHMAKK